MSSPHYTAETSKTPHAYRPSKPLPDWQMDLGIVVLAVLLSPLLVFNLLPRRR